MKSLFSRSRSRSTLSRRAWLAGAGSLCVGLPWLETLAASDVTGGPRTQAEPPKRLVFLVTMNGTDPSAHWPTGSEHDFTLGSIMSPLAHLKDKMVVLRGVDNKAAMATGVNGHTDSIRCMLTGRAASNNINDDYTAAGGISLDQHVANAIGTDTMFKSLEFQIGAYASTWPNYVSFYGANQPVPYESHIQQLWDRIFAGVQAPDGPDPVLEQLKADRTSVLDAVAGQYQALDRRLSAADRERLDAHLSMVREMEQRLSDSEVASGCVVPSRPGHNGMDDPTERTGIDMMAYALSCDLTRVATIGYRMGNFGFLGVPGKYHDDWLHKVLQGGQAQQHVQTVKTWQAEQIAYFVDKLASIPEGTGSVLDNTLIVWADEFCHGYSHQHHEVPYVLISGSDRFFEMGRYLEYGTARSNNELWISIAETMGASTVFGDPQFGDAPLPGL